ncbi:hypothetical protein Q31b_52000 [Novipirellula aureliae]|uniref:Uncharacterized protein n=1 Tax=Novipirellula aureliae TaxID=2527966 RepID=A0A5C6DHT9_9BACT|nr:hypothetical protein [Novipirellula aureliae]TWU35765.1 hypothetical protein Q31b_52000 [Novipirellula aureliae]
MKRLWLIHLTSLIAIAIWAVSDPLFETTIQYRGLSDASQNVGWIRVASFTLVVIFAIGSLLALLFQTLSRRSAPRHRSTRQLLAITTVIAVWFSFALYHDAIAWQGKRLRFATRVDELEAIVAPLRYEWPDRDGELRGIGPFMAYPFGRPTTLLLLEAPRVAERSVYVSAVERSDTGAIKLQLTGTDGGDWAEWHPPGSQPSSFTGGLADSHELQSATSIGNGWYLVRYRA